MGREQEGMRTPWGHGCEVLMPGRGRNSRGDTSLHIRGMYREWAFRRQNHVHTVISGLWLTPIGVYP